MGLRIQTNAAALSIQRQLGITTRALQRAIQRLSSGQRINSARDGAAEIAVGSSLEAQRRGWMGAVRNLNDAKSLLQVSEGSLQSQQELVQRMRELAVQSANGTLTTTDRQYLEIEFQSLYSEFARLTTQSMFNGTNLLTGVQSTLSVQSGPLANDRINLSQPSTLNSEIFTKQTYKGIGTLKSQVSYTVGGSPVDIISADLNQDGHLDVISPDSLGARSVSVLFGRGDGTFAAAKTLSSPISTSNVFAEDFNEDGKLDLLSFGNNTLNVIIGNGDGTFQTPTNIALYSINDIQVGDFNSDGKADIATVEFGTLSILLGNGNGTFQTRTTTAINNFQLGLSLGDLNNDNKIDLIWGDFINAEVNVALGNGNGTFQTRATWSVGNTPLDTFVTDLNGDNKADLVTADSGAANLSIFLGNGNGTFASRTTLLSGSSPYQVKATDLNGDGRLDLLSADQGSSTLSVYFNMGNGVFSSRVTFATGDVEALVAGDFNEDEVNDIAVANYTPGTLGILLANTTTTITNPTVSISTQAKATEMLKVLTEALNNLSSRRALLGAEMNRLDFASNEASVTFENISSSKSQLIDTDMAEETGNLVKQQILQEIQVATLTQANTNAQIALKLLRNI